jgi:hypothetical protein
VQCGVDLVLQLQELIPPLSNAGLSAPLLSLPPAARSAVSVLEEAASETHIRETAEMLVNAMLQQRTHVHVECTLDDGDRALLLKLVEAVDALVSTSVRCCPMPPCPRCPRPPRTGYLQIYPSPSLCCFHVTTRELRRRMNGIGLSNRRIRMKHCLLHLCVIGRDPLNSCVALLLMDLLAETG